MDNNNYKNLYQAGKCELFEISSSNYRHYYIHRKTPIDVLNDLIDYATLTTHFTLDTESQLQPSLQPLKSALVQIEFVYENNPSILIIIETIHLPTEDSPTFKKIKKLCRTTFSNNHRIYA